MPSVLTLNGGSSSIRFAIVDARDATQKLLDGKVERIGSIGATLSMEGRNSAFDMTVLNELDRFHLVIDAINRLPQTGSQGVYLKQQLQDKLVEHKQYIDRHGEDMPEIKNWTWNG